MVVVCVLARVQAQPPFPKPGPEVEKLKQFEGTWDATAKGGPETSKGVMHYKMGLGGLWLTGHYEGSFGDIKFEGRGLDSYDVNKKKYVNVWVDSMSTAPMLSEGEFDKDGKVLTLTGKSVDHDGKPTNHKMVTTIKDKDNMTFQLYMGEQGKEKLMLTIDYKRKK
jgi:hypothetical protein